MCNIADYLNLRTSENQRLVTGNWLCTWWVLNVRYLNWFSVFLKSRVCTPHLAHESEDGVLNNGPIKFRISWSISNKSFLKMFILMKIQTFTYCKFLSNIQSFTKQMVCRLYTRSSSALKSVKMAAQSSASSWITRFDWIGDIYASENTRSQFT